MPANRLAKETSPYLLQHSHNPVDWYPWGEEALQTAREQDKPILVSIGYSSCHWCHVMERESFEDIETARYMNEHFINIKIDREERPDLDHIYMDAVQAITGSGGWPLNVFLTPDARPFYGGTYFPPRPVYNRNSWREVLTGVFNAFRERRGEIENQAASLTQHVATAGGFGIGENDAGRAGSGANTEAEDPFVPATLTQIRDHLLKTADTEWGGFGGAPKFPQTFSIRYLLYDYYYTRHQPSLDQACLSLDKMIRGGIYDQLGGGFARYSTDNEWLAPHFEKMLYDNALLTIALSEAYALTKKPLYREAIEQTIAFITRELSNGAAAFYAALDADSEGIEGKYYVWDAAEIDAILGTDAAIFKEFYGVTEHGNWEEKNILTRPERPGKPDDSLPPEQKSRLESARSRLLEYRDRRVHPGLDDKVLLGWNALMNLALSKAYAALGEEQYRELAIRNMRFLREYMRNGVDEGVSGSGPGGGGLRGTGSEHGLRGSGRDDSPGKSPHLYSHTWKGAARLPAFLDDYACLIAALIQLQEITGDTGYLDEAGEITRYVIRHFGEPDTGFFFYTHDEQDDLIVRKREIYDGATPSGNSMMASNLLYLSKVFYEPEWAERALRMTSFLIRTVTTYPGSFGGWATLVQAFTYSIPEVVITGRKPEMARKEFISYLIPYRVFQSAQEENTQFPLLRDKPVTLRPQIFLCKDYACQLPVNEVATAVRSIENVYKFQG